ncbi:MAG: hypothetical protein ABIS86_23065, partial [Streptosporangiaceae bacterium]
TLAGTSCALDDVDATGDVIPVRLVVPATVKDGTIVLTAVASAKASAAKNAKTVTRTVKHTFTVAVVTPPAGTTTTTSPPPSTTTPPYTGPAAQTANAGITPADQTALPQIAPSATASVPGIYPQLAAQNVAAIRADNGSDQQMTQLAKIQAIWLAGLLAAFSLLFNQLRPRRALGTHRRRSRGTFAR